MTLHESESGLLNEAYFRAALPNRVATARRVLRPISVVLARIATLEAMATSIIESSGCLVVIDCSQMPGRNSQRTAQFSRRLAPHRSTS